jgi:hypothetical protein
VIRKKKRLFFMRQRCFIQRLETTVIAFEREMMGRKVKRR